MELQQKVMNMHNSYYNITQYRYTMRISMLPIVYILKSQKWICCFISVKWF